MILFQDGQVVLNPIENREAVFSTALEAMAMDLGDSLTLVADIVQLQLADAILSLQKHQGGTDKQRLILNEEKH